MSAAADRAGAPLAIQVQSLHLHYGTFHALKDVTLDIAARRITALIGPSGCGKSTLLRSLNRMNDLIAGVRVRGSVQLAGVDIYAAGADVEGLRKRIGMVFQRPNPFPLSVFENLAFGPRAHGVRRRDELEAVAEQSLRAVDLWEALRDQLGTVATRLPLEQQQRLCIARALTVNPEVLLMDEPCSALDPRATAHVEALMRVLAEQYTIVIVTHNMQQARRASDVAAYMLLGDLVEHGTTAQLFDAPRDTRTAEYIAGKYG